MRMTLEGAGYDVAEAADGEQALGCSVTASQFARPARPANARPGRPGGPRALKLRSADACVIDGHRLRRPRPAVDAMKLGATDFVRKPMTPDTLRPAVAAALAKRGGGAPSPPVQDGSERSIPGLSAAYGRTNWVTNGFFFRRGGRSRRDLAGAEHRRRQTWREIRERGCRQYRFQGRRQGSRQSGHGAGPCGWILAAPGGNRAAGLLWREARSPDAGRLVISRATGTMLDVASSGAGIDHAVRSQRRQPT